MGRTRPATPEEQRQAFNECLADARRGLMPPTETGLSSAAVDALGTIAQAANLGQPTDQLARAAQTAFDSELSRDWP